VKFRKKTSLFWAGDKADRVYFIVSGYARVFHCTLDGEVITLLIHKAGDILGIGAVLNGTSYRVSAETISLCEMWVIPGDVFLDMMFQYTRFAVWIAADLAERMKRIDQSLLRRISFSAERRLAFALLDLAGKSGKNDLGIAASVIATHQDISSIIGTCRQTTTHILDRFCGEGIVRTRKGRIEICNIEKLRQIASANRLPALHKNRLAAEK
jgi:CRP-like cAMP-binding protein